MLLKRDIVIILGYFYQSFYRNLEVEGYLQFLPSVQRKFQVTTSIQNLEPIVDSKFQCPICLEEIDGKNRIITNCNHKVCISCFENYLTSIQTTVLEKKPSCCLCRTNITSLIFTSPECCNFIKKKYLKG
jgi:hypothetical protein